jgi:hypothetical protein
MASREFGYFTYLLLGEQAVGWSGDTLGIGHPAVSTLSSSALLWA